ncbi:MAG: GGDEF domain-containing protein [Myxococcota bacterium]
MFRPTSSVRLPALGSAPESYAFSMLTDLLGRLGPEPDMSELLEGALGWVEAAFSADAALFFMLDHGAERLTEAKPFASVGIALEELTHQRLPDDIAQDLADNPRRTLSLGPAGQGHHPLALLFPLNMGSTLHWGAVASLWRRNHILGALVVARNNNLAMTDAELRTLGQMSGCLAAVLEQAAAWRETHRQASHYQSLLHEAPDAITLYDPARDRFIDANNRATELFSISRQALLESAPDDLDSSDLALALSMAELDLDRPRTVMLRGQAYEVTSAPIASRPESAILSIYRRAATPSHTELPRISSNQWTAVATPPPSNPQPSLQRDPTFTQRLQAAAEQEEAETEYRTQSYDSEDRWILCREVTPRPPRADDASPATDYTPVSGEPNPFEDPLTRLTTGALLQNRLEHCLRRARRYKDTEFAVLIMNLDCFSIVNTRFGRDAGDQVLFQTARRIESTLRNTDTAARFEADVFAALLENRTSSEHAVHIARRLLNELSSPFVVGHFEVFLSASIGIATSEVGYLMSSHIIQDARASMQRAKSRGGGVIEIFNTVVCDTPEMLSLDDDLSQAVNS